MADERDQGLPTGMELLALPPSPPRLARQVVLDRDELLPGIEAFAPVEPVVNGALAFFDQFLNDFGYTTQSDDDYETEHEDIPDSEDEESDDEEESYPPPCAA